MSNYSSTEGHLCCFQSSELIFENYFNLFFKNKKIFTAIGERIHGNKINTLPPASPATSVNSLVLILTHFVHIQLCKQINTRRLFFVCRMMWLYYMLYTAISLSHLTILYDIPPSNKCKRRTFLLQQYYLGNTKTGTVVHQNFWSGQDRVVLPLPACPCKV